MEVKILKPYGYCLGVKKAFELAKKAREDNPSETIYLIGSLIHNKEGMKPLKEDNFILIDEKDGSLAKQMESIPSKAIVLYSAHGHDEKLYEEIARRKEFKVYDATCPFILDNLKKMKKGKVAFISNPNHLEALATRNLDNVSVVDIDNPQLDYYDFIVSQTSLDEAKEKKVFALLKEINPNLVNLGGRCPSSKLRQEAILKVDKEAMAFIIVGSRDSANTMRLLSLAKKSHPQALCFSLNSLDELKEYDLSNIKTAYLSSGASASKEAVDEIVSYLTK